MQRIGHPEHAIRQIEYWFKHYIDSIVHSVRTAPRPLAGVGAGSAGTSHGFFEGSLSSQPRPINDSVLAEASHQAWTLAIVRAQRSANTADWGAVTAEAHALAYTELVNWTALKYRVPTDALLSSLKDLGYCR